MSPFSGKNRQDDITIIDDTIMNSEKEKFLDLTPRRPGRRETIIPRRPGRRREHKNPITTPSCEKKNRKCGHNQPLAS